MEVKVQALEALLELVQREALEQVLPAELLDDSLHVVARRGAWNRHCVQVCACVLFSKV